MRIQYRLALLIVAICFVASQFTGWYEWSDVRSHVRLLSQRRSNTKVEVQLSTKPYPQSAEGIVGTSGHSWLTSLQCEADILDVAKRLQEPSPSISDLSLQWKIPCGQGHGAPVAFQDLIVLVTGSDQGVDLHAYQQATGAHAWSRRLCSSAVRALHSKGAPASSTPLCVGDRVIVCWSDMQQVWMASFDAEGKQLWRSPVGATNSQWGFNASPAQYRGLVFINVDNQFSGFVQAVDVETGKLMWRQRRPDGFEGSYSSPLVINSVSGEAIVAISGLNTLTGLDAVSGKILWDLPVVADVSAATPVYDNSFLVASSGFRENRLSVSEFKHGLVAPPVELWSRTKSSEVPYVPTPLLSKDRVFVVQDDGIAQCFVLATGKLVWKKRIGSTVTASPMWLGGSILICGENAALLQLDAESGEVKDSMVLSEPMYATPCVSEGQVLVRTLGELLCFAKSAAIQRGVRRLPPASASNEMIQDQLGHEQ